MKFEMQVEGIMPKLKNAKLEVLAKKFKMAAAALLFSRF